MQNTYNKISKEEQEFFFFMNDRAGSFTTHLINAMLVADNRNFLILQESFPGLSSVVWKYKNTPGYWEELQRSLNE